MPAVRSARGLYRLTLALAALGTVVALAGSTVALQRIRFTFGSLRSWLRDCDRFLLPHLSAGQLAALTLGLLGVVALVRGVRSATGQLQATRRLLRTVTVVEERDLAQQPVRVIAGNTAQAFCMGFLRPRIYLSRGAFERLSTRELTAVIAHEGHHARRRDPLRIAVLVTMADALFFLPTLAPLRRRYQDLAEIAADEAAVTADKSAATLAAALLHFNDSGIPGTVGVAAERVDHLLGTPARWKLRVSTLAGTVAILGALAAVTLMAGSAAPGHVSLAALAMQSCMLAMALAPIVALWSLAIVGRRMLAASR